MDFVHQFQLLCACLEENTTWDLVAHIEKLWEHLDIPEWQVSTFPPNNFCFSLFDYRRAHCSQIINDIMYVF
jgi:hypothetical protein